MYRFHTPRLAGGRQIAAVLMLALAAACGDGPTGGSGPRPGPGPQKPDPDTTTVVASVELDPGSLDLLVAGTRGMSAIVRSHRGDMITGRMLQWTSSDSSVARVDINGNVTALKLGTTLITATLDGRQGQATIRVVAPPPPAPVAHVTITGGAGPDLEPGEARELGVVLHAANGSQLMGRAVTWSSSDSSVASVTQDGLVVGVRGGTATIRATSEGVTGTVTFIIPEWLVFDLDSLGAQPLPRVMAFTSDTTSRTEHGMVVRERRVRMAFGRLWLSTIDWRYRQRYDLQTWEREITHVGGNVITGTERLVSTDVIRDEGLATGFDLFWGSPIYKSTTYAGHEFRVGHTLPRGRVTQQSIPGTTYGQFTLHFSR